MKKTRAASSAVFSILALLCISSCSQSKEENTGKTGAKAPAKAISAEVYLVKDTTISEQMRIVGSVVPNEEVQLVSEVSRKLTKILLKEGDYVRQGQVLFRLDDADLQARLKKLNAQRTYSAAAAERQARLLKIEGVSKQEYEQATSSLEAIDADIEMTRVEISKTIIRAPFAGKTGIRRVSEGAFVTQNTVMATVEDLSKVKIEFAVPEKYANGIKLNEHITFRVENSSSPYQARILVMEPAIDQNTRSLFVRALADNKEGQLIPGSSAMVELELNKIQHAIMIPSQALISGLNGNSVWVLRSGKVASTSVDIGFRTNKSVQITRGLVIGDTLMTTNLLRAKPDLEVKVVKVAL